MLNVTRTQNTEVTCFKKIAACCAVYMTMDWLDFAVEHMSKWWKALRAFGNDALPYNTVITPFQEYVNRLYIMPSNDSLANIRTASNLQTDYSCEFHSS